MKILNFLYFSSFSLKNAGSTFLFHAISQHDSQLTFKNSRKRNNQPCFIAIQGMGKDNKSGMTVWPTLPVAKCTASHLQPMPVKGACKLFLKV